MRDERGNALWIVLMAVVLLGLLTMVLSRGGSSTDQSGSVERGSIKASQIVRYSKSIEAAVQEMRLRGVSESDISFENAVGAVDYTNANCTSTDCQMFEMGGAGLSFQVVPEGINGGGEWLFNATNAVAGVGTAAPDLVMILPDVSTAVCASINALTKSSYAGEEDDVDFTAFTGSYVATEAVDLAAGQEVGCIDFDNAGTTEPFFYHVLIKR